jgi:hypothetical protein
VLVAVTSATAEDWPQFRGKNGRAAGTSAPLEWSNTTEVYQASDSKVTSYYTLA